MDREGDSYAHFTILQEHEQRYAIRMGRDRRLQPGRGATLAPALNESLAQAPVFLEREIMLSARGNTPKRGSNKNAVFPLRCRRLARLEVRADRRELFVNHNISKYFPHPIPLNFVEVREVMYGTRVIGG